MARLLSSSDLVPTQYRETGNNKGIANTMIALNIAQRMKNDPIMVMQNLNIIQGRPSWSSSFIIAAMNACGRFSPLEFIIDGEGDDLGCYVTCVNKQTNKTIKGPRVTVSTAKKEGWYSKNGSKWPVMPEVMCQYRAASFFGRLYAPDILMGMSTDAEVEDAVIVEAIENKDTSTIESINARAAGSGEKPAGRVRKTTPVDEAVVIPTPTDPTPPAEAASETPAAEELI